MTWVKAAGVLSGAIGLSALTAIGFRLSRLNYSCATTQSQHPLLTAIDNLTLLPGELSVGGAAFLVALALGTGVMRWLGGRDAS